MPIIADPDARIILSRAMEWANDSRTKPDCFLKGPLEAPFAIELKAYYDDAGDLINLARLINGSVEVILSGKIFAANLIVQYSLDYSFANISIMPESQHFRFASKLEKTLVLINSEPDLFKLDRAFGVQGLTVSH
jgi:hypothetical protein